MMAMARNYLSIPIIHFGEQLYILSPNHVITCPQKFLSLFLHEFEARI